MTDSKTKVYKDTDSTLEKQLQVLSGVSEQMIGQLELPVVLRLILDNLVGQLGYAFSGLFLLHKHKKLSLTQVGIHPLINKIFTTAIGGDLTSVFYIVDEPKNQQCYLVRSVLEKKFFESSDLKDFSTPDYINPKQALYVQKLAGIKLFVAIPVMLKQEAIGCLVVATRHQDIVEKDKKVLQTFANQISIAIYNAQLFSKVQQQVTELTQQAMDLSALHDLSSLAGSSLNKLKVLQVILDRIPQQLGHLGVLGGSVLLKRGNSRDLQPAAFTTAPELPKVVSMLTKKASAITELVSPIDNSVILRDVIDGRHSRVFADLHEAFPDAVSERTNKILKKMGNIQSFVMLPIISGNKVFGASVFYLNLPMTSIDRRHSETLQVCTNHIAAGVENSSLFEQLGTQYKTVEDQRHELSLANKRLQALDQTKSEFISIASHQLRTPLTVIKGYLSMIMEGSVGKCDPTAQDTMQKVMVSTDRLVNLINDLLDISRIERGKMQFDMKPGHVETVVQDVFNELETQAKKKGLEYHYHPPTTPTPVLQIDPFKLRQTILNMIDNSVKYTPKGSIDVTVRQTKQEVRVEVTDTGIGMTEETRNKLFQKFNRGEGIATVNTEGLGLGLFVAKQIVEHHGGTIWAESPGPGKGSTFGFSIPLQQVIKK